MSIKDIGLLTELTYGVTRWRNKLDWLINSFLKKNIYSFNPWIRNILRLGTYQLIYLNKIPAYAAINESVESAKKHGHQGLANLINAVLRRIEEKHIRFKRDIFIFA